MSRLRLALRITIGVLGLLCLVFLLGAQVIDTQGIEVRVDGTEVTELPGGFIDEIDHQLYVPVDFAAEALGGEVFWGGDRKTVYVKKGRTLLVLPEGNGRPVVNGRVDETGEPARDIKGVVYVQFRYISEVLGYSFSWREDDREVEINALPPKAVDRPRYSEFHKQGMVTFSYDDGCASHYNLAYPLHLKYGLPASFNIVTGWTDKVNGYMTKEQLRELSRAGFEIASHSDTHPNQKGHFFKDLTADEAKYEIEASKNKLVDWGIPRVEGFVVPGSVLGDWLVPMLSQHYKYTRALQGRKDPTKPVESGRPCLLEYSPNLDKANLPSFAVVNGHTPEDIIRQIDQAAAEKKWLIIMMHKLGDDKNDYYTWDPARMERVLQYAASRPRSELMTVTLQDGFRFASGLGDYQCDSIEASVSSNRVNRGDRVLLISKGFDENGVEVPAAGGYSPRWEIVSGDAELVDCQDGTAVLTADGRGDIVARCSDPGDPSVCSEVRVSARGGFLW